MTIYSIKKAAILLVIVTIIEKILGFGREMVIASQFGASNLTDAYNAGYLIPYFITALFYAGLINVYAPVFLSEKEIDERQAWDKINSISTYLMVILLCVTILCIIFSKNIAAVLYPGFDEKNLNATASISRIFFAGIFIYSASIIVGSLLNCFRQFVYPLIAISILSLGQIIAVPIFGGKTNINSIAYGYFAGAVLGLLIQFVKLKRLNGGFDINFKMYPKFASKFAALLFPVLVATSMSQINVFIDRIFASYLPPGSMSFLSYGNKVVELPITLFSGIIATIIFPDIIEYTNKDDKERLKTYVNKAIIIILIFLIPSFVGLDILNKEIVKILYERNVFSSSDTINTASALFYYSPTIILYGCTAVISKVYYSMKDTKTLMYISIITILLNGVLDYVLMIPMAHNGLALATSIVAVFQFAAAYIFLKKKINISMGRYLIKNIFKICTASIGMAAVLYFIKFFLPLKSLMIFVILSISAGGAVYFILVIILRVDEVGVLIKRFKHKEKKLNLE